MVAPASVLAINRGSSSIKFAVMIARSVSRVLRLGADSPEPEP